MLNHIIRRLILVSFMLLGVSQLIFAGVHFLGPVQRSALYVRYWSG